MRKKRMSPILSLVLSVILGAGLFTTSEAVQRTEKDLKVLQQKLAAEQENLHILEAEWAYLNRPDRLEQLAAQYLSIGQAETGHILASLDVIAEPLNVIPPSKPAYALPASLSVSPVHEEKSAAPAASTTPPASFQNLVARLTSPAEKQEGGR